ncbi:MAG: hypothetical protein MUC85_08225 [Anaerolineales bacterium]|nr:hypothetical protein [Anaerolineales bacterium]
MNNRQRSRRGTAQQVGRTSKVHPTCRSWLILFVGVLVCVALNPVALDSPAAANALPAHPQAAQDTGSLEYLGQIGGENTSVAIQGNYAYVSHGTSLVVLDITDPAMPVKMGRTPSLRGLAGQATLAGDYAYLILRPVWPDTIYRDLEACVAGYHLPHQCAEHRGSRQSGGSGQL